MDFLRLPSGTTEQPFKNYGCRTSGATDGPVGVCQRPRPKRLPIARSWTCPSACAACYAALRFVSKLLLCGQDPP